jgi:prophage regulatory protein
METRDMGGTPTEKDGTARTVVALGQPASSVLPRVITRKELRLIVPYTPQHILRLEKQGKFPKRIQIGARRVGWYLAEIEAWLAERSRGVVMKRSWLPKRP